MARKIKHSIKRLGSQNHNCHEYYIQANWKLIFQNYSECYHCPAIYPDLGKLSPDRSGKNYLYSGPYLGGFMRIDHPGGSLTVSGKMCGPPLGNLSQEDLSRFYHRSTFPQMLRLLFPDYLLVHRIRCQNPSLTDVICQWLFDPQIMSQKDFIPDDAVIFWDSIDRQDWQISELRLSGVALRADTFGCYSNAESWLAECDRKFLKVMGY